MEHAEEYFSMGIPEELLIEVLLHYFIRPSTDSDPYIVICRKNKS